MQLTDDNLYFYLLQKGLINTETVVDGGYQVYSLPTRTQIKKVILKQGPSLFIKQAPANATASTILKREYEAYKLLKEHPHFAALSENIPALFYYDDVHHILVTELIPKSVSLHEHYMQQRQFSTTLAAEQASLLAGCHLPATASMNINAFPKQRPWVLQLDAYEPSRFFPESIENAKLITMIRENPVLSNGLQSLKQTWAPTHFIHGDVKWINFLFVGNADQHRLSLIDWELADIGDPAWDVAGLLQSYISAWIFGFDNQQPYSRQLPQNLQAFDITAMQAAMQTYLSTYLEITIPNKHEWPLVLEKIMQYTAARILQTSIEGVVFSPEIKANNMRCLQLAYNIFSNPLHVLESLLGIQLYTHAAFTSHRIKSTEYAAAV